MATRSAAATCWSPSATSPSPPTTPSSARPARASALLARVVGEKKAREIWYLCRRYTAQEALQMGLVNAVVPQDQLDAEVKKWCDETVEKSPTAIALAE